MGMSTYRENLQDWSSYCWSSLQICMDFLQGVRSNNLNLLPDIGSRKLWFELKGEIEQHTRTGILDL